MKRLKLRKRECKFGLSIFMIILLLCAELPCNVYASEIEGEMTVSENDVAPITETMVPEMNLESSLGVEMELESRTVNFNQKIAELRSKFPHGKYWNHYVSRAGEDGDSLWNRNDTSFQDSVTDHPCATHNGSASVGQYDCNFYGGFQCCGFAKRVYKYVYGVEFSSGSLTSNWWEVEVGDLICFENGNENHYAFVIERNGNKIKIVEANRAGNCRINWDREVDLTNCGFKDSRHKPSDVDLVIYTPVTNTSLVNLGDTFCAYITSASSGKVLTNDNTNVSIRTKTGAAKQLWSFERQSDGTYKIYSVADLKCLDVYNSSSKSGTNVQVYWDNNYDAQRWQIYKSGDAYALSTKCTNCVLDIDNGSTSDGANVQMWDDNGTAAQKFKIQKISDTTAPVISNLNVSNITKDGYTVTGKVSDNVGVLRVSCGSWGPGHNEQNAIWENATISNGTFTYRVSFSKIKCNSGGGVKRGTYMTDIYVHDVAGNSSGYNANTMHATVKVTDTLFDTTKPNVTSVESSGITNSQFSICATATDNLAIGKIEFICYAPGQTNGMKKTVAAAKGTAMATYKLSEFTKAGEGTYRIEVYAYDEAGNKSGVKSTSVYVNCTAPTITDVKILKTNSNSYTLQATVADSDEVTKIEWITWKPGTANNNSSGYILTDTINNQKNIILTKTIDVTGINGNNPVVYGSYVTKIIAYDKYNNKREYSITIPLHDPENSGKENASDKNNINGSNSFNNAENPADKGNSNTPPSSTSEGQNGTEGFVYRLYNVAMNREADEAGFNDWNTQLKNKQKTAAEVAQGFIFSEEFKNYHYNNEQYVKILYRTMFGREADEGGLMGWVTDLENGMSREYVYRGFVESAEFSNLCERYGVERGNVPLNTYRDRNAGATGFIARLYTKTLGREYDGDGLEYWCRKYHTRENTIEEIATVGFLHSQELQNLQLSDEEFVRRMYQTFLNREPEEAGLQDWIGRLRRGEETRDSLVYGFTNSREFANLKKEYNLP